METPVAGEWLSRCGVGGRISLTGPVRFARGGPHLLFEYNGSVGCLIRCELPARGEMGFQTHRRVISMDTPLGAFRQAVAVGFTHSSAFIL
jgi:hypothetical protein